MYFLNGLLIFYLLLLCPLDGFAKPHKWVDEKGCLSGDCQDGVGTYFLAEGRRYMGEFKDGLFHGQGIVAFPDGKEYLGGFKNGIPHGQGILTDSDGKTYAGEFRNGKLYGQATFIETDGTIHKAGKPVPKNPISMEKRDVHH